MPGFFDFSAPDSPVAGANSPSWMGSILGQDAPIAPESYDIFGTDSGSAFDSTSVPQSNGIPYDAMAAMNGISMPQLGTTDSMGRYGITDAQRQGAGNKAFSNVLFGAAQSFMGGGAAPSLEAGRQAGAIQDAQLDKASLQNMANYKLQAEAKMQEMDFIGKKSNIAKQQMAIEQEQIKLDSLKQLQKISAQFGEEMKPVVQETLAKAAVMYPDKVAGLKHGFLSAQAKLAAGDLEGADRIYDETMKDLPEVWQRELNENIFKQTVEAANRFGMGMETVEQLKNNPESQALGISYEVGPNGLPMVVTARELEERRLKDEYVKAQTFNQRAYGQAALDRPPGGASGQPRKLTEQAVQNYITSIDKAVQTLSIPKPPDMKKWAAWEKDMADARGSLSSFGVDPNNADMVKQWSMMTREQKQSSIRGEDAPAGGAAPPPVTPGNSQSRGASVTAPGAIDQILGSMATQTTVTPAEMKAELIRLRSKFNDPRFTKAVNNAVKKVSKDHTPAQIVELVKQELGR